MDDTLSAEGTHTEFVITNIKYTHLHTELQCEKNKLET